MGIRILLVEDDFDVREIMELTLQAECCASVVLASSGFEAIEVLKKDSSFDLIVSDYHMPNGNGKDLFTYLQTNQLNIPFVLCSGSHATPLREIQGSPLLGYFEKPLMKDSLFSFVNDIAKTKTTSKKVVGEPYARVKVSLLMKLGTMPSDLFVQLSDKKYVKIINADEYLGEKDYEKFVNKKIDFLYVARDKLDLLLKTLIQGISTYDAARSTNVDGFEYDFLEEVNEAVYDLCGKVRISKEVQTLAKVSVQLALNTIGNNPSISDLFKKLGKEEKNYISLHGVATTHLSCWIADSLKWKSNQTFYKMAMAALLHDITIKDHELAQVEDLNYFIMYPGKFSFQDIEWYKTHPVTAARIASDFTDIPPDVDEIILQHHERADGSGCPNKLKYTKISPLAAVFIVAHDLAKDFISNREKFSISNFLKIKGKDYDKGHFQKVMLALEEARSR